MATHSSILAWEIPWTEGPGRPQFMGLQGVGHDKATNIHTHVIRMHTIVPRTNTSRIKEGSLKGIIWNTK